MDKRTTAKKEKSKLEKMKTIVLNEKQINQKLIRIAYQILEDTILDSSLLLVGIKGNGAKITKELAMILGKISQQKKFISELEIDKKNPLSKTIQVNLPEEDLSNSTIVLIDDVINSGRTMQYALMRLLEIAPKRIKTVALVDRKHRDFPIRCDYVGLTLSTTLQDRIEVEFEGEKKAYLV